MADLRKLAEAHEWSSSVDEHHAALATIRAVLGGDVPEIPNERSES